MGYLQSSSTSGGGVTSHLYSQALQMKLYQAFIFSIPILFSIILFLLFYLFYLKRTLGSNNNSSSIFHLRTSRAPQDSPTLYQCSEMGSKVNLEDKLNVISFDEDLYAKESMCCVCLGEFEMNEKLHQIPSCQHMFHAECIRNWLHSNATCPLCRCSVVNTSKGGHHEPLVVPEPTTINMGSNPQEGTLEHSVVIIEGSSSSSMDSKLSQPDEESVVAHVQIQIHDS